MSSQPAAGNEDKASENVQEENASLQVIVPDAIRTVPQPSHAMERQLAIASPRWDQTIWTGDRMIWTRCNQALLALRAHLHNSSFLLVC